MRARATMVLRDPPLDRAGLHVDPARCEVTWKGRPVPLTVTEMAVVAALARRPGLVRTRDQILDALGDEGEIAENCVSSHIRRIRRKFEAVDPAFAAIRTVYGAGYSWGSTP